MLLKALGGSRVLALKVVQVGLLEVFASGAALPAPSRAQLRSLDEVIIRRSEQWLLVSQLRSLDHVFNLDPAGSWIQHFEFMQ